MKRVFITLLVVVLCITAANAVPADRTPKTIQLSDGRVLTFSLRGDESVSWATTMDGYTLLQSDNGDWVYAKLDKKGNMIAGSMKASNLNYRTYEENVALASIPKNLKFTEEQLQVSKNEKSKQLATKGSFPLTGSPKLLVVLVDFSDKPFTTTRNYWQNIANQPGCTEDGATGSMRDYYYDNSMGALDLDITVLGPCRLPQTLDYYGRDQGGSKDINVRRMVRDAIEYIDTAYNIDFTAYDNDDNDTLDNIHIIFAGIPQSTSGDPTSIWPHASKMYGYNIFKDGVRVVGYSCSGERNSNTRADGIGALCHEFGHILGLPDMYDTQNDVGVGLGNFSLMHGGCYNNNSRTPPLLSSVERNILGWHDHTTLTDPAVIALNRLADSNVSYKLTTGNAKEYYILENRQKVGWDAYNPGGGMLILHVDKNVPGWTLMGSNSNTLNTNPTHQGCYIVSANGDSSNYNMNTPYPTNNNNKFTNRSTPISWSWYDLTGNNTRRSIINKPVSHIKVIDSVIQFNYMLLDTFPDINILSSSGMTSSSIILTANLIDTQRVNIVERGICWSTSPEPTLGTDNHIADSQIGEGIYSITISNLQRGTNYYARAYAINSYCTTYSPTTLQFTTLTGAPRVTTRSTANITSDGAVLKGRIDDSVDAAVTRFGFLMNTTAGFELNDPNNMVIYTNTIDANAIFSAPVTPLNERTRYYVRAFAENEYGVGVGTISNFITTFEPIENNLISENQLYCGISNRQPISVDSIRGTLPTGRTAPYTYLWQSRTLSTSWTSASGTNNEISYIPGVLSDSTYYRRIVTSTGINDTSNTILIAIVYSHGGHIQYANDTVNINESFGRLRAQNYVGSIVQWERKYEEGEWQFIAGSVTSIFDTLKTKGNYSYRVKIQNRDCEPAYSSEKKVYAKGNVGIVGSAAQALDLRFVPNPSTGIFIIECGNTDLFDLKVINTLGKVCYSENNVRVSGKQMDLTNLANGMYIVTISNKTVTTSVKLIINK